MGNSDVETVTEFITSSGGPSLDAGSIQWIKDLDAGRRLLEWLGSQLSVDSAKDDEKEPGFSEDDADIARRMHAATQDFTLEVDEVKLLNDVRVLEAMAGHQNLTQHDGSYVPPLHLKKHAELINAETSNVQREVDFLRSRISQTKGASKKLSSSINTLQRTVHEMDAKIRISEEALSELSITGSTTISSTIGSSQELLLDLGSVEIIAGNYVSNVTEKDVRLDNMRPLPKESASLEEIRSLLLGSKRNLTALIAELQEWTNNLDILHQEEAERALNLQMDMKRLQASFNTRISKLTSQSPIHRNDESEGKLDKDIKEELEHICYTLEQEVALRDRGDMSGGNTLDHLLSELHEGYLADKQVSNDGSENSIVQDILRNAWMMDQIRILKLHADTLSETITSINSALTPLEEVYNTLSKLVSCVQESETTLEALVEELGDITFNATNGERGQDATPTVKDAEMKQRTKDVLNDYKDLRLTGPSPLLLFTREDIVAELRSLKARSARVEGSERTWSDNILQQYSSPIHPALLHVYANAQLNSSPPFAFPYHVRELEAQARKRATELQNLANSVEEEVRKTFSSESNSKRLEAFVEKWCEDET